MVLSTLFNVPLMCIFLELFLFSFLTRSRKNLMYILLLDVNSINTYNGLVNLGYCEERIHDRHFLFPFICG